MSFAIEKSPPFHADVTRQFGWYCDEVDEALAWRFFKAVDRTLGILAHQSDLGRLRRFRNPRLRGYGHSESNLRSIGSWFFIVSRMTLCRHGD